MRHDPGFICSSVNFFLPLLAFLEKATSQPQQKGSSSDVREASAQSTDSLAIPRPWIEQWPSYLCSRFKGMAVLAKAAVGQTRRLALSLGLNGEYNCIENRVFGSF